MTKQTWRHNLLPAKIFAFYCLAIVGVGIFLRVWSSNWERSTHTLPKPAQMIASATPGTDAPRPTSHVKPISCVALPNAPGKSISTLLVEFPPGAYTGPHRHPGSVVAFVVGGTIRSQMEGSAAQEYAAGASWFESPMALHMFAENVSLTETATLLATIVADEGCAQLVIPEPSHH